MCGVISSVYAMVFAVVALPAHAKPETATVAGGRTTCRIEECRFIGNDADRVGPEYSQQPSGVPDGHLRATLSSEESVGIKSVMIRLASGGIWAYPNQNAWTIGVYSDGEKIRPEEPGEVLRFQGEIMLDFYIEPASYGFFGTADELQVVIRLSNDDLLVGHCKPRWDDLAQPVVARGAE